jgi:transmembrane sensor
METNNNKHKDQLPLPKVQIGFKKSKEDIWSEMETKLVEKPSKGKVNKGRLITFNFLKSVAAIFILIIGIGAFMKFYTIDLELKAGNTKEIILPDGSRVQLSGNSSLSYAPFWWKFQRKLTFEGEAFFNVQKGSTFKVSSALGSTEVLGTSFNILSTHSKYDVYCKTGKVRVKNSLNQQHIITPGQAVSLDVKGKMIKETSVNELEALAWLSNKFIFNTTPLTKVIGDIERYYDIKIEAQLKAIETKQFTGILDRKNSVEEVLQTICYSFDLKAIQVNKSLYQLKEK